MSQRGQVHVTAERLPMHLQDRLQRGRLQPGRERVPRPVQQQPVRERTLYQYLWKLQVRFICTQGEYLFLDAILHILNVIVSSLKIENCI